MTQHDMFLKLQHTESRGKATINDWISDAIDKQKSCTYKRRKKLRKTYAQAVQGIPAATCIMESSRPNWIDPDSDDPFESGYNLENLFREEMITAERDDVAFSYAKFCSFRAKALLGRRSYEIWHICFFQDGHVTLLPKHEVTPHFFVY